MGTTTEQSWWNRFFDETYADFGLVPTTESARESQATAAQFIYSTLNLRPGQTVFDQCCGIGRLSLPLAQTGVRVVGVDQVPSYISRAEKEAAEGDLPAEFYSGDALEFVAPELCDAAFNWFTSFGYHQDDDTNRRMLDRAYESLKPGGQYALDYVSLPKMLREFRDCQLTRFEQDGSELWLIVEPEFDFTAGMVRSNWTFMRPDKEHEVRRVEMRAYMPSDLVALLTDAGFVDVRLFGSTDGDPFDRFSRRCIVVGEKPKS